MWKFEFDGYLTKIVRATKSFQQRCRALGKVLWATSITGVFMARNSHISPNITSHILIRCISEMWRLGRRDGGGCMGNFLTRPSPWVCIGVLVVMGIATVFDIKTRTIPHGVPLLLGALWAIDVCSVAATPAKGWKMSVGGSLMRSVHAHDTFSHIKVFRPYYQAGRYRWWWHKDAVFFGTDFGFWRSLCGYFFRMCAKCYVLFSGFFCEYHTQKRRWQETKNEQFRGYKKDHVSFCSLCFAGSGNMLCGELLFVGVILFSTNFRFSYI